MIRGPLGTEHDRRDALPEIAREFRPDRLRPRPLGRRLRRPEALVVAGGIEEEAPGVAEQVVPVGLKLGGPLGSHSLILPILATPRPPLSGELVATFDGDQYPALFRGWPT